MTLLAMNVLLCQRSDGKFLRLIKTRSTTDYSFVEEPSKAERITTNADGLIAPKHPTWYFENSRRARELWTKDCKMVAYLIETKIICTPIIIEEIDEV